jgi:heat-inducible transcriptional repressor
VAGRRFTEVADALAPLAAAFAPEDQPVVASVVATLLESLVDRHDERLAVAGTANLTRFGQDFELAVKPVLEALEEQVVLLRLLGEASTSLLTVRIGHENPYLPLSAASVVSVGYGRGDEPLGTMGVLGPTRMDYPGTMAAVGAVARYVSHILAGD